MKDAPRPEPDPVVEAYKRDIDRTLIRENLKLTVEERFRNAMALARFADELRRAGKAIRNPMISLSMASPERKAKRGTLLPGSNLDSGRAIGKLWLELKDQRRHKRKDVLQK